eukprot:8291528-Lingulodinium_polyedra.AAC.1
MPQHTIQIEHKPIGMANDCPPPAGGLHYHRRRKTDSRSDRRTGRFNRAARPNQMPDADRPHLAETTKNTGSRYLL